MFDRDNDRSDWFQIAQPAEPVGGRARSLAVAVPVGDVTADPISDVVVLPDVPAVERADAGTTVLSPYVWSWRKRALDLMVGVPLALLALPVVLLLALVTLVSLRSWPFFVQRRVGRDGRLFRMVKIRTLPRHTPRYASKYELGGISTTRTASYLRKTHLDELPQLFLVCLGSMSLVGPRPEMAQLMDRFDPADADLRTSVRPGCTGLWQVSEDSGKLIHEVPHYDRAYLEKARPSLDLFLLRSTLRCAFRSGAAATFDNRFRARFGLDI